MARVVVAPAASVPPGGRVVTQAGAKKVVIFNLGGEFFALLDRCPHQGGPLGHGETCGLVEASLPGEYRYSRSGELVRCPWHGWEFDIRTGLSRCQPARVKARRYDVGLVGGRAVAGDDTLLVAETLPVSVEQEYIVIDV